MLLKQQAQKKRPPLTTQSKRGRVVAVMLQSAAEHLKHE